MPSPTPPARALLISFGGTSAPLRIALREFQPTVVWYFCSHDSRASAEQSHAELTGQTVPPTQAEFLECSNHEELDSCYAELRHWLSRLPQKWAVLPEHVCVDYTGGTKTMSAALVLAATECFTRFSYVGGHQRAAGLVLDGHEVRHEQPNPWRALAIREIEQAALLWNEQQYAAAALILRKAKAQVPLDQRPAFDFVITLAGALADRLALQLKAAATKLGKLADKIADLPPDDPRGGLLDFCHRASQRLTAGEAAAGPAADPMAQLRELLDNALLTARLGRYDDASARLYRALELYGQNELDRLTHGAFRLGQLKRDALPPEVAGCEVFKDTATALTKARRGIALEEVYRVLAHLGHEKAMAAKADFDGPDALKSAWRQATQRRNQSILAHGVQPVGETGFAALAHLLTQTTGCQMESVDLPPPALQPAWFAHNPQP